MKTVDDYEKIRKAYYVEGLSIRAISRQLGHCRKAIRKALDHAEPEGYQRKKTHTAPMIAPYQSRIEELIKDSEQMPRKQRYTGHKIYQLLQMEGYRGSESNLHRYVSLQRQARKQRPAYLPLEFDLGQDAQVDWGEAQADINGMRQTVQMFVMRLNYSKARFVMAFPFQKQEAFFEGHIQAFHFFGGVPRRITYDNLKTAVFRVLEGHHRQEQRAFTAFRSYYLFESNYCTPAQGHEKGGVESDVGYAQRNFFAPIPKAKDFAELNAMLHQACLNDLQRSVRGETRSVAEVWHSEKPALLPLDPHDFPACSNHMARVNPYSQVVFETNRYSVPAEYVGQQLALRAYSFRVEVLSVAEVVAEHPRCLEREQDILNPLHYLGLLEQRPGAFEYALPVRQWRQKWTPEYEKMLDALRQTKPDGRGVREFVAILKLHRDHPADMVNRAVKQALDLGAAHLDGVQLCLRQLLSPQEAPPALALDHPKLASVGYQPVYLEQYNQLLEARS
ncbi:MAG TPA: IS21 family transposase [Anaerolineales bacterium]|nr:IS21 family transposase [Anaerolineales bacterium]